MKCVYCNSVLVDGAQFCPECGKQQPAMKPCASCGQLILAEANFCEFCGSQQPETTQIHQSEQVETTAMAPAQASAPVQATPYSPMPSSPAPYPAAPPPAPTNNKPILIALCALLALILVGGGVWWMLNNKDSSTTVVTASSKSDEELKKEIMDSLNQTQGIAASPAAASSERPHTGLPSRITVTGTNVRLRYTPEINSYNIHQNSYGVNVHPRKGQSLEVVGEANDFYQVRYKGGTYYISKLYSRPHWD